jgi:hypothetical protein
VQQSAALVGRLPRFVIEGRRRHSIGVRQPGDFGRLGAFGDGGGDRHEPVFDAARNLETAVGDESIILGQLAAHGFDAGVALMAEMDLLDQLLGAERQENADHDDADFAEQCAPAVHGLGDVYVRQVVGPLERFSRRRRL